LERLRALRSDPAGQVKRNRRPHAQSGRESDAAAGLSGERENLRHSEPRALAERLGGEEGLEHPMEMLRRDAAAGVGDGDLHIVAGRQLLDLGFA
jgi:hypothetical protein